MKRMILIRAALFAVFAFMGTLSLSAQAWLPPAQAIVKINTELTALQNEPPTQLPAASTLSNQQALDLNAKSGCTDCMLKSVKKAFLHMSLERIKLGMDTGPAVQEVRDIMVGSANNNVTLLDTIQQGFIYMDSIL